MNQISLRPFSIARYDFLQQIVMRVKRHTFRADLANRPPYEPSILNRQASLCSLIHVDESPIFKARKAQKHGVVFAVGQFRFQTP